MKISKHPTKLKDAEIAFDAIIESLFEYKNLNIENFNKDRILLVSFENEIGADYNFDYSTFLQGAVGQLIVIKSLSTKIFGEKIDGRKLIDIINNKIKIKNDLKNKNQKFTNLFNKYNN